MRSTREQEIRDEIAGIKDSITLIEKKLGELGGEEPGGISVGQVRSVDGHLIVVTNPEEGEFIYFAPRFEFAYGLDDTFCSEEDLRAMTKFEANNIAEFIKGSAL